MHVFKAALTTVALTVSMLGSANSENLVTNGGFETGDFSGWVVVLASSDTVDYVRLFYEPHSGSYAAGFQAKGGLDDTIYQDLATAAGNSYNLTFWLDASEDVTGGHFAASVAGVTVLDTGPLPGGYQEYSYNFTATSATTRLSFMGNAPQGIYYLDDISVSATAVSEPSTALMTLMGAGFIGAFRFRRRARLMSSLANRELREAAGGDGARLLIPY